MLALFIILECSVLLKYSLMTKKHVYVPNFSWKKILCITQPGTTQPGQNNTMTLKQSRKISCRTKTCNVAQYQVTNRDLLSTYLYLSRDTLHTANTRNRKTFMHSYFSHHDMFLKLQGNGIDNGPNKEDMYITIREPFPWVL